MKNWCFQIVVLEKTLESPLDSKEIKLVHPKGNQPWILIETTDAEAEAPILWVSDVKRWLLEKKKKPWCWKRSKAGEGDNRTWDGWMASLTQWTWGWASSGGWWWTGRRGVLQSMGCQKSQTRLSYWTELMNWCETWTIKNAKCHGTDAFKLWCWRRLLKIPWIARRSNQSIPKEINLEYSLEGQMLQLKLWYSDHLMWTADSLEKTDAGKDWGQEEKGATEDKMVKWHHCLDWQK